MIHDPIVETRTLISEYLKGDMKSVELEWDGLLLRYGRAGSLDLIRTVLRALHLNDAEAEAESEAQYAKIKNLVKDWR